MMLNKILIIEAIERAFQIDGDVKDLPRDESLIREKRCKYVLRAFVYSRELRYMLRSDFLRTGNGIPIAA